MPMPSILSRLFGERGAASAHAPSDTKSSRAAGLIAHMSMGLARWAPRNYVELTRHGYERNAIVYRSVRMIAEAAASIPWRAYDGREEIADHPLLTLLARPNPTDVAPTFFEALYSNLMLFGNGYVEASLLDGAPRELYVLRSDRMAIVPGPNGWPMAYDYIVAGDKVRYPIDARGIQQILQLKLFHPLDDHYGFSPLGAAQAPLDVHNAASGWTKALLDNSARPSGALVYAGPQGSTLSDEQFDRLKAELEESFSGPRNAGRPLLLEGGLDWKALSLTPKDMDFIEAKAGAAREIALAFGVPPLLLGLPGDNTFSNYQEANRAFWRQTVIPLVSRTQKSFAAWLRSAFGDVRLDYDVDRIDALAEERATEWTRVGAADFLTNDEKREALGYGKTAKAAVVAPVA
jgi:HK97 family phage portal protein